MLETGRIHINVNNSSKWTRTQLDMHWQWWGPGAKLLSLLQISVLFFIYWQSKFYIGRVFSQ